MEVNSQLILLTSEDTINFTEEKLHNYYGM